MPPSLHRLLFLVFFSFISFGYLVAQPSGSGDPELDSLSGYIQMKYGLDQDLFNGFQYYKRFSLYKGDPFFPDDVFYNGSVSIRGMQYDQIRLKYNCYSQDLILEYTDFQERYNQLRLNTNHIDSFQLGAWYFQKLSLSGDEPLFYQLISSASLTCYIHWKKDVHATSDDLQYSHEYTRALGTYYIAYKGDIQPFSNKKTFIYIFPESIQAEIKKYFRHQRLSFREAGPGDIQKMLDFINQLEEIPPEQ